MPFMQCGIKMGQRYRCSPEFDLIWQKLHPPVKHRGLRKKTAAEKKSKAVARVLLAGDGKVWDMSPRIG
jgi:hypothetical protein